MRDVASDKLSHAYMLHFPDNNNLRDALKLFAFAFFGAEKGSVLYNRISNGSFPDFTLLPEDGKKMTADAVNKLLEDSVMRPVEGNRKLYAICNFENLSALLQNKLLKTLEEPQHGVCFILGATATAPVLETVRSRVKTLDAVSFSEKEILAALDRKKVTPLNAEAAKRANGILGNAENLAFGGWFNEVYDAAAEICAVDNVGKIGEVAAKYADINYKNELLAEMQRVYFTALTTGVGAAAKLSKPALTYALESVCRATAELKLNAYFQGLLYDFLLGVVKENLKWQKMLK